MIHSLPKFLSIEAALLIHRQQITRYGGMTGMRDQALLASAIGQAQQTYFYTSDIYQAAAQYGFSILQNHPFLDGNKRTAMACLLTFLALNELPLPYTTEQLFDWTHQVITHQISRENLANLLRK